MKPLLVATNFTGSTKVNPSQDGHILIGDSGGQYSAFDDTESRSSSSKKSVNTAT
jgi:hypothetical protein